MLLYKSAEITLRPLSCVNSRGILLYRNCLESCKNTTANSCLFLLLWYQKAVTTVAALSLLVPWFPSSAGPCNTSSPRIVCLVTCCISWYGLSVYRLFTLFCAIWPSAYLDMGYLTVCLPYSVLSDHLRILIWAIWPSIYLILCYLTICVSLYGLSDRLYILFCAI
jgi:hypothetical protein